MKKILLLSTVLAFAVFVQAQNYESIKNMTILMQFQKAKDELDKNMSNAKFTSKPEAYILKTTIYAGLAADPRIKETPEADRLMSEAATAFTKYREMDPQFVLLKDLAYQNGPINLYTSYFNSGYKDYQNKKWQQGFDKFKIVVEISDLLISQKIIPITTADTNSLLLAGILAEQANLKDEAAKYYIRIADMKVPGPDYESIYRYLVRYSFTKKDMVSFEKYKALGKQLYPTSDFFTFDKVDFAVGLEDDFNKKIQALDEALAADPNNEKAQELLGELIYDTLYSRKPDAVMPANAAELEKKMVAAFKKSGELNPESELSFLFLGNHYITKSIDANDAKDAFDKDLKARTKPGIAISKTDQQKKDALEQDYSNALEGAREPFEKAAMVYAKKDKANPLSRQEKAQYKKIVGYLADIYTYKKGKAKGNAADLAKFTEEEKKWNDLYDTIK